MKRVLCLDDILKNIPEKNVKNDGAGQMLGVVFLWNFIATVKQPTLCSILHCLSILCVNSF